MDHAGPDAWEEDVRRPAAEAESFHVDLDGFEGPLDLLLALARSQKVDLGRISILALAEQYLGYIGALHRLRLEIAAEYLVMAAWLAFLKSRLLLPDPPPDDEPTGAEMAAALALRLRRLEAIRAAAAALAARQRLGRDVFGRGAPEAVGAERRPLAVASLYDLLTAYAVQRQRSARPMVQIARRPVWSLAEARAILERMIGRIAEWTPMESLLPPVSLAPELRRSALASTFGAGLELVREGRIMMRQSAPLRPLHLRDAEPAVEARGDG